MGGEKSEVMCKWNHPRSRERDTARRLSLSLSLSLPSSRPLPLSRGRSDRARSFSLSLSGARTHLGATMLRRRQLSSLFLSLPAAVILSCYHSRPLWLSSSFPVPLSPRHDFLRPCPVCSERARARACLASLPRLVDCPPGSLSLSLTRLQLLQLAPSLLSTLSGSFSYPQPRARARARPRTY